MVARVEKWSTTGGQIFDNREDAERAEMSEDVRAFMESLWRRSDTKVSKHQFTAIADLITDHIDEFRAVITGIAVEEQQQQPDLPFHDSDDGICSICDGGPGNNSTCSCP